MKSQYSAVIAAINIPPQVKIHDTMIKTQALLFLINKGPAGIPIKKKTQNAVKTAFTEIRSVYSPLNQRIETI